jgi:NDP-sugar pyrophosphorylase family protein
MNIIIPMAGGGERFVSAGYKDPKPLIVVNGRHTIEYVCDMYDKVNDSFLFICNERHLESTDMYNILKGMVNNATIISMPQHKLGPVYTVLAVEDQIIDEEPTIVSYCDNPVTWDYNHFKKYVRENDVDGCIISHTGFHPHTLSSTLFAYSKTTPDYRVLEIKEKSCYTGNRFNEHASSGVYYFKRGDLVRNYFRRTINENISYNGEYYVTLVFNLLIQDGLRVYSYLNDIVLAFGTPREVQNFEAWLTIIRGGQVHNECELGECYNYWRRYLDGATINRT